MNNNQPQPVQPQPVPTNWGFDHTEDGSHVVIITQTPEGSRVQFVTAETAEQLADAIRIQARKALKAQQTSLLIPPKIVLGPDGQPLMQVPPSPEVQAQEEKHGDG